MDYSTLKVVELRKLVMERKIGSGAWRVGASQAALIEALETGVAPQVSNGSSADLAQTIALAIAQYSPSQALDETRVRELISEALADRPNTRIEIKSLDTGNSVTLDKQHKAFPTLLHRIKCRTHTWLVGPAGSGKTTAALNVASALGLDFYFTGAIDTEHKLLGFIDAQGRYVSKEFRKAYEHGGVFLFDEIGASYPAAVLAFNAALANETADFPDGPIKRHKDFVCIAADNTWNGPTAEYSGRTKQDGSTKDRFALLEWNYDEELELSIVSEKYPQQVSWANYVQSVRAKCKTHGIAHIVSPRATFEGAKSQLNGGNWEQDVNDFVRKGLNDSLWQKVS